MGGALEQVDTAVWGARARGVAALERELARLRRAQTALAVEQGVEVARASVLNLVVYATRDVHARRAARTIAELSTRHPSRAIVVRADRAAAGVGGGELAMHCHLPPADASHQICYEQILVRARAGSDERIASAVIPLLLADLPVFLWWTGTPPRDSRAFDDLCALAGRLVIDSADFARPELELPYIATVLRDGRGRFGVTDFNWTRLTVWRDLLAGFFDVPTWRPLLDRIVGVRLGFAVDADGRDIHPSQALLLLGWLASRLGWRAAEALAPSEAGGLLSTMRGADDRAIRVRVRPRFERGLDEGDLSGLRLQAMRGGQLVEFVVKREPGRKAAVARVEVDGAVVMRRIVPLPGPTVQDLLGEELTIVASDRVFEDALAALVALT